MNIANSAQRLLLLLLLFYGCWFLHNLQRDDVLLFSFFAVVCDNNRHCRTSWDLVMPIHGPTDIHLTDEHQCMPSWGYSHRLYVQCVRVCVCVTVCVFRWCACAKKWQHNDDDDSHKRPSRSMIVLVFVFFALLFVFSLFQWYAKFCTIFTTQCQTVIHC